MSAIPMPVAALDVEVIACGLLGRRARALTRIGSGRNSRVYRVDTDAGTFALKQYFRHPTDSRDRRAAEFDGLRFARRHGISSVAEPVATDCELGATAFRFIDGAAATGGPISERDLDQLARLLVDLSLLTGCDGADELPPASEANFTMTGVPASVLARLKRLQRVGTPTPDHVELTHFLAEVGEELDMTERWAEDRLAAHRLGLHTELPPNARTLSPSDVGFHNALRRPDGGLTFVDFEYFGWDDPAKTASDLLLHPGMALSDEQRGRILGTLVRGLGLRHALLTRIRVVYPLYALKWCTILLNEYVPEHLERRLFADPTLRPGELRRVQLAKARDMLNRVRAARAAFPYEEWVNR
jgi:hypothetical protein